MLSDYDYNLPDELIAQEPLLDRASSRLIWVHNGKYKEEGEQNKVSSLSHHKFSDIVDILQPNDLLIMNDTRVTALRLMGRKETGAKVEALLLQEIAQGEFVALTFPARKLKVGTPIFFDQGLVAKVTQDIEGAQGQKVIQFQPPDDPLLPGKLLSLGKTPLPPYIKSSLENPERYQTVYASHGGSAAAPTAGLHFTEELLEKLSNKGVKTARVTLHVSMDTFRPLHEEDLKKVKMHGERCSVPQETIDAINACTGRIIAVGTTSVRTLETFAIGKRKIDPAATEGSVSKMFIWPGGHNQFKIIDGMFTNFHMPKTTMLMMISSLAGWNNVKAAYDEAVREKYRFLSFGDSMLLL